MYVSMSESVSMNLYVSMYKSINKKMIRNESERVYEQERKY